MHCVSCNPTFMQSLKYVGAIYSYWVLLVLPDGEEEEHGQTIYFYAYYTPTTFKILIFMVIFIMVLVNEELNWMWKWKLGISLIMVE